MKKIIFLVLALTLFQFSLQGQWYYKEYGVQSIEMLSDSQLSESLQSTNKNLISSGWITGIGVLMAAVFHYGNPELEDPGILEQIIGNEGMKKIGTVVSLGAVAGGGIACIILGDRRGKINTVIRNRNPYSSTLNISPTIISNSQGPYSGPGLKLTLVF